jgi:hypothetical protein
VTIPVDGGAGIAMSTDIYMHRSLAKRSGFLGEVDDAGSD